MKIVCRAKSSRGCRDGRPSTEMFGEDAPLNMDGTFLVGANYPEGSLVCDLCYFELGQPLNPVLEGDA